MGRYVAISDISSRTWSTAAAQFKGWFEEGALTSYLKPEQSPALPRAALIGRRKIFRLADWLQTVTWPFFWLSIGQGRVWRLLIGVRNGKSPEELYKQSSHQIQIRISYWSKNGPRDSVLPSDWPTGLDVTSLPSNDSTGQV